VSDFVWVICVFWDVLFLGFGESGFFVVVGVVSMVLRLFKSASQISRGILSREVL
jgi:hypothetical protein